MKPPTRAALYARVSTTNHSQDVGLQLDELHAVAKQRGWEVVGVYEDSGISGTQRSRPALDRLVADCKAGEVDVVVVWKLDRLAHSIVHVCSLAESLARIGSLNSVFLARIGSLNSVFLAAPFPRASLRPRSARPTAR